MTFDDISILDMLLAIGFVFALELFIFFMYKRTFIGVINSVPFGVSIITMALITVFINLAVTSNIIPSLGMVGALSIVLFITAVIKPLDIAFLFGQYQSKSCLWLVCCPWQ